MQKQGFVNHLKNRFMQKSFCAVSLVYICLCIASAVYWAFNFTPRNMVLSLLFSLFVPIVLGFEYALKLRCGWLFLTVLFSLSFGAILGTCFNFYTLIPFFDLVLHGVAGFIFSCLGFALSKVLFKSVNTFLPHLIFALCFSLAVAVAWEIFEYVCTLFLGPDMMEDSIVHSINSYYLAGSHLHALKLENIIRTVIYYGEGQTYTIDGYLDIGLGDTMTDVIICTAFTLGFVVISSLSNRFGGKINSLLIPQVEE